MYTRAQVASRIDHAVLKPEATDDDIRRAARMCRERGVGCLVVRPTDVPLAVAELGGSACRVCAVAGFPHGHSLPETKALETRLALSQGAVEVDMVMNVGRFLSGDEAHAERDIAAVADEVRRAGALLKVILETCYLRPAQIERACRIAQAAGAHFVKTSTGFGPGGATLEATGIMLRAVGDTLGVKASGGIRTWAQAAAFLDQGCRRLGVSGTEAVLDGAQAACARR